MIKNSVYGQIVGNYFKNSAFVALSMLLVSGMILAFLVGPIKMQEIGSVAGHWSIDLLLVFLITVVPLIAGFMWPASLGFILKAQFANPRATLFPSFRTLHIQMAFLFYAIYLLTMFLCRETVLAFFGTTIPPEQYFITVGFLSIVLIWFAYFFHNMIWQYFWLPYFFWIFGGEYIDKVAPQILLNASLIFFSVLTIALAYRLRQLKEGMREYAHVVSMKQKDWLKDHYKRTYWGSDFYEKVERLAGFNRKASAVSPYPSAGGILSRVNHWKRYIFGPSHYIYWFAGMFTAIMIFIDLRYPTKSGHISSMSFFIMFFPSMKVWTQLTAWGRESNFQSILGYDLLKPIRRDRFILEVGLATLVRSLEFWLAMFVGLEIVRLMVVAPGDLSEQPVCLTGVLSLSFQFIFFAAYACTNTRTINRAVSYLMNFFVYVLIFFMGFIFFDKFSPVKTLIYSAASVIAGLLLSRIAYRMWCSAELS